MRHFPTRTVLILAALLGAPAHAEDATNATSATAAEAVALDGAKLFMTKTCFTCHGKDAKTPILPLYPRLAGQNPAYALQQMKDIQSGARTNGQSAAMRAIMHLVNEDEMKALADYIATLPP
jgi:cytochrome c